MNRLLLYLILLVFLPQIALAGESAHPGSYAGSISFTNTNSEIAKPVKQKSIIRMTLGEQTTMTLQIDDILETQLNLNCQKYHGVGSGYIPFLGEQFFITLPMHFDAKTGNKMTGSIIFSRVGPGAERIIEGKFKAVSVDN